MMDWEYNYIFIYKLWEYLYRFFYFGFVSIVVE